ncbi:MAG: hypothetical protein HRT87_02440 [Legionellales bacterium]|nr:hypothetical protein [Legionellales bacterium]
MASAVTLRFVQTDDSPVNHHNPFHSYTHVLDIKVVTNKQTFNNHIEDPLNIQQEKQLPYGQSSSPL